MLTQLSLRTHPAASANMAAKWGTSVQPEQHVLLQSAIESLADGILILTKGGAQVYANHCARQLCTQRNASKAQPDGIPKAIERVCQTLVQRCSTALPQTMCIEAEVGARESRLVGAGFLAGATRQ